MIAHHYQKCGLFAWNSDDVGGVSNRQNVVDLLNKITVKGVFQTDAGLKTGQRH